MDTIKCKIIVLLGVVGVSFSAILVKYASAPSVVLAFYRMLLTALLLLPAVWRNCREELKGLKKKDLLYCCASGFFLACHFSAYFESIRYTSIASSTVLVDTEVFFVALITVLVFRERLSAAGAAGILLTFAGSVLLALSDSRAGSDVLHGDLLALAGAVFVSVYTLIGRRQRTHMTTTLYTFLVYAASALVLSVFCAAGHTALTGYEWKDYGCALGMAVFCTLLGHSVFSWGLKYVPAAFISTAKLGEPVFATLLGLLLFGQVPGTVQIIGGMIILAGLWMYVCLDKTEKDEKNGKAEEGGKG